MVENFISQISGVNLGGITNPQGINLDDDTFSKLLEKSMQSSDSNGTSSVLLGQLGMPAGFEIQELDLPQNLVNDVNSTQKVEIKDLDMGENYFSSLAHDNINVMNLAKKQATNAYNMFSKGFVDSLNTLVEDVNSITK
jgi:hypothetical protein